MKRSRTTASSRTGRWMGNRGHAGRWQSGQAIYPKHERRAHRQANRIDSSNYAYGMRRAFSTLEGDSWLLKNRLNGKSRATHPWQPSAARALSTEPHARAAHYDEKAGRIVVDLTNGAQFAFPPRIAQGLARAKKADVKEIVITPKGTGLHWPKLDADLTVAGLLAGIFGSRMWMRELASTGGKVVSERKAAAARANGAKGGRPRLVQAA